MTRQLLVVNAADVSEVARGLRAALSGDGPAILPHSDRPDGLPDVVPRRVALVVETSGSTGGPKRVALSADALLASAAASESALGDPGQWLLALPVQYIAGINVLVRSFASEIEPVAMDPAHFSAESFLSAVARMDHPVHYVSLVPAQLARLMASDAATDALRGFARVLVGGQSLPSELASTAHAAGVRVTRSYGSSETSGGCVYDGVPIGNTEVAIVNGRVEIAGTVLAEGYLDDPRRTAFAFRVRDGKHWYRTDDTGALHHGTLSITGRVDDVIVSGGIKVSIAEVEAVVRDIPGLAGAVVVAAPHPEWGEVPVVVTTENPVKLRRLRELVALRLGPASAPDRVLLVNELPLLASGKPDRLQIATLALK